MILEPETQQTNDATVAKPSFSFARENRLHLQLDYTRVFRTGRRYRGNNFTMMVSRVETEAGFKAGFVVRKKECKRAVDRNRIKRRMREVVRLQRHRIAGDVWMVLMGGPAVQRATWETLNAEFLHLCQSAGIDNGEDYRPGAPAG